VTQGVFSRGEDAAVPISYKKRRLKNDGCLCVEGHPRVGERGSKEVAKMAAALTRQRWKPPVTQNIRRPGTPDHINSRIENHQLE